MSAIKDNHRVTFGVRPGVADPRWGPEKFAQGLYLIACDSVYIGGIGSHKRMAELIGARDKIVEARVKKEINEE